MKSIEELVQVFTGIPLASANEFSTEVLIPGRAHLSRGAHGEFSIFLEGSLDSFGQLPPWGGVEHNATVTVVPAGKLIAALRISSSNPNHGNRIVAHIAYELLRRLRETPEPTNRQLLEAIGWVLPLLGDPDKLLSDERQYGLIGEAMLLHRLLGIGAQAGVSPRQVLERWKGSLPAARDFAAKGIAVEVKTTSQLSRRHSFSSIEQLDPQAPGEQVYLFSVGLRRDYSAPKKLPDYLADVESSLVDEHGKLDSIAMHEFRSKLAGYGFDFAHAELYRSQPGFAPPHLPPALYPESGLARIRMTSFKGDVLPEMVVSVGYALDLKGAGLPKQDERAILLKLIEAPAI